MSNNAPTVLYIIRHGETAWNVEEVFRGRADVELNQRGHDQARAIARALATENLAAVYASPLQRAASTAHPIAQAHGLALHIDERLTDLDFGEWEGVPLREAPARWPELFALWERDPGAVTFPGGESLPLVRERALSAVEEVTRRHQGAAVAIVTHRVVTKLALLAALGLDDSRFWRIRQDNGCINRIERATDWVVTSLNDLCHLRGLCVEGARDF